MGLGTASSSASTGKASQGFDLVPEHFVEEVKARADILQLISRTVPMKKTGSSYVGLCPFHKEKSPSFSVSPDRGVYHCFGCGASGGALTWLMEHDGIPFRDAVRELASNAGLALPPEMTGNAEVGAPAVDTAPLFQAMATAAKFFSHVLRHWAPARAYLKERGLDSRMLKEYVIGAAPDEWRGLVKDEVFPDYETSTVLLQAALVRDKTNEETGKTSRYDFFRNRITFGVRDTRGRLIAFGGRAMDAQTDPKYLNSSEGPIFNKSDALFGLFEAREAIRLKKRAYVVEGYMDVVMLAQHGVKNSVAAMGTSFTRAHAERLLTQTNCAIFSFDGDAAGRKAAFRALETMIPMIEDEHDVRFLICPPGKDPDDLAREEGGAAFDARGDAAPTLSEFLISELTLRHNGLKSTEDRARFAAEAGAIAGRLSYKTKLRRLVLEQIAAESRIPGAAMAALKQVSNARRPVATLWRRLADAALLAPREALEQREILIELLEASDPGEAELASVLMSISDDAVTVLPPTDHRWLAARDALAGCIDLVMAHREAQLAAELRAQFEAGTITPAEYMRQATAGVSAAAPETA